MLSLPVAMYPVVITTYAFLWLQRSVRKSQQLTTPAEKNTLVGYSDYHSYSKHFPNYNFRNYHIIHATPAELSVPTVSTGTRPKTCNHCAHLFNNGAPRFGSIHSTLAYAKCRCHRPDTSNKLQSLRENHSENTTDKLFKRVGLAHVAKDSPQTVLPSLTKSVDHHSEQPLIESSFSELTASSSKLPTLKRYSDICDVFISLWMYLWSILKVTYICSGSVVSIGSSSQHRLHSSSQHRQTSSGLMKRSSKFLHNSTAKLSPITEANSTTVTVKKKRDNFKVSCK